MAILRLGQFAVRAWADRSSGLRDRGLTSSPITTAWATTTCTSPNRGRIHTDNSVEIKYYDHPEKFLDKMAFSVHRRFGLRIRPQHSDVSRRELPR